mgnify:CR=1 FL=1
MCKICRNENLEGLKEFNCSGCQTLTNIPNIKGLELLDCSGCPSVTNISNIEGLKELFCHDCPLLTYIPNIEGLKELYCTDCPLLSNIPNIKGLYILQSENCPLLTYIPNIEGLKKLYSWNCQLLSNIPNIEGLEELICSNCPLLMYIPNIQYNLVYDPDLLKSPYVNCNYLTSKKMDKLYKNICYLWKSYKLRKYALYLEKEYYSNPRMPYMQYYISNELYNEDEGESSNSTNDNKLRIGYINSKNELIWYKC